MRTSTALSTRLVAGGVVAGQIAPLPFLPRMAGELGLTPPLMVAFLAADPLARVVTRPAGARIGRRIGARWLPLAAVAGTAAGLALILRAPDAETAIAGRIACGAGAGLACRALFGPPEQVRGRGRGTLALFGIVAFGVGVLWSGLTPLIPLTLHDTVRPALVLGAGLAVLAAALAGFARLPAWSRTPLAAAAATCVMAYACLGLIVAADPRWVFPAVGAFAVGLAVTALVARPASAVFSDLGAVAGPLAVVLATDHHGVRLAYLVLTGVGLTTTVVLLAGASRMRVQARPLPRAAAAGLEVGDLIEQLHVHLLGVERLLTDWYVRAYPGRSPPGHSRN